MDVDGGFYLGRIYDLDEGKSTDDSLVYQADDLTTHAVVVGMTGSGKTGLCVDIMEEAALKNIPALMIDPKGDIANLLLHFPDLAPEDFQPWVNVDQARQEGKTIEEAASDTAKNWKEGLAGWGIGPERVRRLKDSVQFTVYTPGSDSGVPVSILASLKAPVLPWEGNRETLREEISGTVTALLGLVGLNDIDPVRSREHILLSNIFENAWSRGKDLDLAELILQTQNPPFSKLGVFEVNTFFPEKERFELAMLLNNILAAPAFQVWLEGQPLDVPSLLYTPEGRARHSIFYIAHLPDAERMFFVTLLFSAVEAWMRAQPGSPGLRALMYFDEIFGYLPPTQNPPSKPPMLRMLKQARAFGVGLVLVTQNPVDLDYKGLSNAGTWFIGKLQTDQDKQRLLDGLEGASPGLERQAYDRMISGLGKRVFLLHNVHEKKPQLFQTRWAMSFLAGPLARVQLAALNRLASAGASASATAGASVHTPAAPSEFTPPADAGASSGDTEPVRVEASQPDAALAATPLAKRGIEIGSVTRPAVPSGIEEYVLPNNLSFMESFQAANRPYPPEAHSLGLVYRPVLLAQANVRFFERKYNLDYELRRTALAKAPDRRGIVRWEECLISPVDSTQVSERPDPQGRYAALEAPLSDARIMTSMQKDFLDWVYQEATITLRANEDLKVYAGPNVSQVDFRKMCAEAARAGRDAEMEKVSASFDRQIESLQEKLTREQRELEQDESEFSQRKMEELGTAAETVLGLFGRRRRSISTSLTKRRMTTKAGADVKESKEVIAGYQKQIAALEAEKGAALDDASRRWEETAGKSAEIRVAPMKKDILVEMFGVAWFPYHMVQIGEEVVELPGYYHEIHETRESSRK